jgi:hypothetical protein
MSRHLTIHIKPSKAVEFLRTMGTVHHLCTFLVAGLTTALLSFTGAIRSIISEEKKEKNIYILFILCAASLAAMPLIFSRVIFPKLKAKSARMILAVLMKKPCRDAFALAKDEMPDNIKEILEFLEDIGIRLKFRR